MAGEKNPIAKDPPAEGSDWALQEQHDLAKKAEDNSSKMVEQINNDNLDEARVYLDHVREAIDELEELL